MISQIHLNLLQNSKPYQNWVTKYSQNILNKPFQHTHIKCESLSVENIQPYQKGKQCYATLLANSTPSTFPKRVCIDKPNITVLLILSKSQREYVLMVAQTGLGTGYRWNIQLPNGDLDEHGDFTRISGLQLESSLGFIIKNEELYHLGLPYHFYQNNYDSVLMSDTQQWTWLYEDDTTRLNDLVSGESGWYSLPKSNTEYTNFYTSHQQLSEIEWDTFIKKIEVINAKSDYLKFLLIPKSDILNYSLDIKTGHALALYQKQFNKI